MTKLLISYYTETNSTLEVCDYIKSKLDDYDVTTMPLTDSKDLAAYSIVILAAPVHGMRWHQKAYDFLERNQESLKGKKVVYIALASMAYQGRHFWQKKVYNVLNKPSKLVKPNETAIFGGVSGDMPNLLRFVFGISKDAKKDQRDWQMIDEWIANLRKQIG